MDGDGEVVVKKIMIQKTNNGDTGMENKPSDGTQRDEPSAETQENDQKKEMEGEDDTKIEL